MQIEEDENIEQIQEDSFEINENQTQYHLLQQIIQDSPHQLLNNYQKIFNDKQFIDNIKTAINKLSIQAKQVFYDELWQKVSKIIADVTEGKQDCKRLKQSGLLQLIQLIEKLISGLSNQIYEALHTLLEKENDYENFDYVLKSIHKIAKYNGKRQELVQEVFNLFKQIKDNKQSQKFIITRRIKEQSNDHNEIQNKIIFELCLAGYLLNNGTSQARINEQEYFKITEVIKSKPYPKVLKYMLKHENKNKKIVKEILDCDFKVTEGKPQYIFNNCCIHKDLQTRQTFLKTLELNQQKIYNELRVQNFIVQDNTIFCKLDIHTLKKVSQQSKLQLGEYYSMDALDEMVNLIIFLLDNSQKQIYKQENKMEEEKNEQTVDRFLIYVFMLFTKEFFVNDRNGLDIDSLMEKFNIDLLNRLLKKTLTMLETQPGNQQVQMFAEQLVKVLTNLLYRNQFVSASNFNSETSQLIVKVLLKLEEFPTKWRSLRRIKSILDRWGMGLVDNSQNFTLVVNKFLNALFDPRLKLRTKVNLGFPIAGLNIYNKILGNQINLKIKQLLEKSIQRIQKKNQSQDQYRKLNEILYKMICLYLSRIKIPNSEIIADLLFKLYTNNAHEISLIYCFRTWILNYSNKSKDGQTVNTIKKLCQSLGEEIEIFKETISQMSYEELLKPINLQEESSMIGEFLSRVLILTNNLELKQKDDIFDAELYSAIISLIESLNRIVYQMHEKLVHDIVQNKEKAIEVLKQSYFLKNKPLYLVFANIFRDLSNSIRLYICNLNKMIEQKDQVCLIEQVSSLYQKFTDPNNVTECNLILLNDLFGFKALKNISHLEKFQIYTDYLNRAEMERKQYLLNQQDYFPFNIVSILYSKIKPDYPKIIKNLIAATSYEKSRSSRTFPFEKGYRFEFSIEQLTRLATGYNKQKENENHKKRLNQQASIMIQSILLPSVNIFGQCFFNNKFEEKAKEDYAFGILMDQLNIILSGQFSPKEIACLESEILSFLEVCKDKQRKVIDKQLSQQQRNPQRRQQNRAYRRQIINQLSLMGFGPQIIEIAMEQVDENDPAAIIDWLQFNQPRLNQILTNRIIERSRVQSIMQKSKKIQTSQKLSEIQPISYSQFTQNIYKATKSLVKTLVPQLFTEFGQKIKDLIFVCLDSFQDETFKNKQYIGFAQKIFKQIDELGKVFSTNILSIAVACLEIIISKKSDIPKKMHQKMIPHKLLSFLDRCDQKVGQKILSVINKTLPTPDQKSSPALKEYINYIGDILLQTKIKSANESQILFKMTKAKDPTINEKVLKIVGKSLAKGALKQKIFSIVSLILDSDKKFSTANIQFDLKSFIIQNHDYNKKDLKFLRIDSKKFSTAFIKFEDNPYLLDVLNKICIKKNGQLMVEIEKQNLFTSDFLNQSFLKYDIPNAQKILVQDLVALIAKEQDLPTRVQYIRELYKTLQFYKLLIPFCLRIPVQGITFFQWLIERQFPKSRGQILNFVSFLFVRNGLYLNGKQTFSDYLISKLLVKYMRQPQLRKQKWVKFLIIYLLQISNFNQKTHLPISPNQSINLKQFLEKELEIDDPINYMLISEAIYLISKKQLIDSLSNKYMINNANQFTFEKQFMNMDLFYTRHRNSLYYDTQGDRRASGMRSNLSRLLLGISEDNGGQENSDLQTLYALRRLFITRQRQGGMGVVPNSVDSIFIPIQPPANQQQPQQGQLPNNVENPVQNQSQPVENERKSSISIENKREQNKMQEEVMQQQVYLVDIIQRFEQILPKVTLIQTMEEKGSIKIPQQALKDQDLKSSSYNVTIKQPITMLDQKILKTAIFKQRIAQIAQFVLDPNEKFIMSEEKKINVQIRANTSLGTFRHHNIINRLVGLERQVSRDVVNPTLNLGRILSQMPNYQEPPQPPKEQQKKQMPASNESQMKQEKKEESQQNKSQQKKQESPINAEEPPRIQMQQIQPEGQENRIVQENNINQPQQPQQNEFQMVEEVVEPHREILAMLGLPQTFLRDLGIDAAAFDCLPQDTQIEQLNVLIQQNATNQQRNQQQANQTNPNNPNQANEMQNQMAAFIASLDPQLRAQTLLEATPEFLMALPPAMRAEAQNYRQRQISQMLQQQEMQYEQQRLNRVRVPKNLVFPDLTEDNFPEINLETAVKLSKSMLVKIPKLKLQSYKILLENKKTQKEAINTLLSYIKNIEQIHQIECTFNKDKKEWEKEHSSINGPSRKIFVEEALNLIEQHFTSCIYKDKDFLQSKHNYQTFSGLEIGINKNLHGDEEGYYPLYEFIQIAIDNHHFNLLNKLIKYVKELPQVLRKRIVKGIRDDKFTDEFYANLEGLSADEKFKQAMMNEFPEDKPIKIETLSKILKYNFSKFPYLKKLHLQTLKKCKGNPPKQVFDFLNQIFSNYTANDVKQIEHLLLEHKATHFHIIKYLYEEGKSLDTQPIKLILKFPHLLDFETKRFIFQHNPKLHKNRHRCVIEIDRLNLFQDSFNQLMNKTVRQLQGSIKVVFIGEQAQDAGGPKKQWFLRLSKEIFDPRYALFEPSSSGNTYQPNPKSYVNAEHLNYFKFIGRFFAKALVEGMLLDAFFTRSFYKMILGQQLQLKDLQEQDYNFYKTMVWFKENKMTGDEDYTFSYVHDYFGKIITKELVPGGEQIPVTEENKLDYIHKYTMAMMRDAIGVQIQKFLEGFYQILPKEHISFFEATQLQLLMSGMPSIDLKDLKENTDYQGYTPTDQIIKWYWEILEEYTNQDLARLIQFITGTSKIPLQGFSKLQGMHGPQKISIHRDIHIDQLPKSHTCFNQLDLPDYPTKQILKQRLRVAITWGSEGFGFM